MLRVSELTQFESLASLLAAETSAWENLISTAANAQKHYEALEGVAPTIPTNYEAAGTLIVQTLSHLESLSSPIGSHTKNWESLLTL